MLATYAGMAAGIFIARGLLPKLTALRLVATTFLASLAFFVLSNFGTWLFRDMYPHTFAGLLSCYYSAIPFYKAELFGSFFFNTIMGNMFYTGLLFGAYALLKPVFVKEGPGSELIA